MQQLIKAKRRQIVAQVKENVETFEMVKHQVVMQQKLSSYTP